MKIGKIEFDNYSCTKIPLDYLKELLIRYYYKYKTGDFVEEIELERDLIITEIKDNHQRVSTIVFSVSGSPPKGIGILLDGGDDWRGTLILIGAHGKHSKEYLIQIDKEVEK